MTNVAGPNQIEFIYEVDFGGASQFVHAARFNCILTNQPPAGSDPVDFLVLRKSGNDQSLDVAAQLLWDFYRQGHATGNTTLVECNFWALDPTGQVRTWLTAPDITDGTGANPAGAKRRFQNVLTFRSAGGGIIRWTVLEGGTERNDQEPLNPTSTTNWWNRCAGYAISAESVIVGRDNGFPIQALRMSSGENEQFWRRDFR